MNEVKKPFTPDRFRGVNSGNTTPLERRQSRFGVRESFGVAAFKGRHPKAALNRPIQITIPVTAVFP
jgi:hypothetical protein